MCNRTDHEYPDTAIELLALDIGGLAALIKIVPTFDSNDLIGVKARTPQKLPDYSAAGLSQCACASLRASRITRTDYQNSRFAVLSQPLVSACSSRQRLVQGCSGRTGWGA